MPYESQLPYHTELMQAAAVYCSDGRVCEQYDDFLKNGLGLPRYDRVAVPGGPACLAGYDAQTLKQSSVIDELKFLVEAHGLRRVILIQHEDCAFYKVRLSIPESSLENAQKTDLARAAAMIQDQIGIDGIEGYFARRTPRGVLFEAVTLR